MESGGPTWSGDNKSAIVGLTSCAKLGAGTTRSGRRIAT
jgi:hypothetical protein